MSVLGVVGRLGECLRIISGSHIYVHKNQLVCLIKMWILEVNPNDFD